MTDPKKLLKSKLQNRLSQQSREQKADQPVSQPSASTTSVAPAPAKKSASRTKAASDANKAKSPAPSNGKAARDEQKADGFNLQLEALINQHQQPKIEKASARQQHQGEKTVTLQATSGPSRSSRPKRIKQPKPPRTQQEMQRIYRTLFLYGLVVVIVALDQLTKSMAYDTLIDNSVRVTSWFDLILVFNPGAAFSLLADSGWQRPFLVGVSFVVSLVLIVWLYRAPQHKLVLPLGLACILGGAAGNLIDRALYGHVIDFISVHYQQLRFPTFNLADAMITVGAILLIVDMALGGKEKKELAQQQDEAEDSTTGNQQQPSVRTGQGIPRRSES